MINLLNKLLSRFHLKLVSTKPVDLIQESVKFLNTLSPDDLRTDKFFPPYVGDIVYLQKQVKGEFPQVSGETYYKSQYDKYFCDYDGDYDSDDDASFMKMYEETTFTPEQLQEKLNND